MTLTKMPRPERRLKKGNKKNVHRSSHSGAQRIKSPKKEKETLIRFVKE
jgi:hypothetical protein